MENYRQNGNLNDEMCYLVDETEGQPQGTPKVQPQTKINISRYLTYDYGTFHVFSCSEPVTRVFRVNYEELVDGNVE